MPKFEKTRKIWYNKVSFIGEHERKGGIFMEKKKMKIGKKILLVILALLAIFIILVVRKMFILKNLQSKVEQYMEADNYKATMRSYDGNSIMKYTTYKRDEKTLSILKNCTEKDVRTLINYEDNEVKHTFIEAEEDKIVILEGNGLPASVQIADGLATKNFWQFITMAIFSDIQSEECNGKQCYKIYLAYSLRNRLDTRKMATTYFDKETGLKVRELNGINTTNEKEKTNMIIDYYYEFNQVKEEEVKEPNISEYTIQN